VKILLISYHHLDEESVGSLRGRAMARYLPLHGIEVAVLTGNHQSELMIVDKNIISIKDLNHKSKALFHYIWRASQKSFRILGFYKGIHSYWLSKVIANSEKIIKISQPDVILASYPCVEALEIGIKLSESYGIPLVADFRDGLLFEPLETKMLKQKSFQKHYKKVEKKVAETAKLVISVSEPITNYFSFKYNCLNLLTLPNGFDDEGVDSVGNFKWDKNHIHLVHTGRISSSRESSSKSAKSLFCFIDGLLTLQQNYPQLISRLKIHFVGSLVAQECALLSSFLAQGLVVLWGHQPRSIALELQRKADYLLLITASDQASLATGKIFEYLASGKPILAITRGTEAERIIYSTGAGVVVDPNDTLKITEYLKLVTSRGSFGNIRKQNVINAYSRSYQMKQLAFRLTRII
jgi:glycosyltransferase involved in cell wall biosynthesis